MDGLARFAMRHRLWVGIGWLVITIVGVVLAPSVSGRLKSGNHMNTAAYRANEALARRYGGVTSDPGVVVLDAPLGQAVSDPGVQHELRSVDAAIRHAAPGARTVSYASTHDAALIGNDSRSTVVLVFPPRQGDDMAGGAFDSIRTAAQQAAPGLSVSATSLRALESGSATSGHSSVLTELLIGAAGALIVLGWVFGSLLALLPLIMAIVSVLTMQLLIYGLTFVVPSSSPLSPSVQYIVALLGLGLSMDYALLVVTRWREERRKGLSNDRAVAAAMAKAGHSVWFSGLIASLGLFALIIVPNSVVRGIGIAGLFIPSTATLVALTLLPVVLSKLGSRLDWPRRRGAGAASRFWSWWSERVIRHRVAAAAVGLAILFGLAGVAATINISQPTSAALASTGRYTVGLRTLESDGFPSGILTTVPIYVPNSADAPAVARQLSTVPTVRGAVVAAGPGWQGRPSAVVVALPTREVATSQSGSTLGDIRSTVPPDALVGGEAAQSVDQVTTTYSSFPLLFVLVALVTFVLLARGLRSILLAAKAVVLNVLSVAAAYGILVLVFQHGFGMQALWGTRTYGAIDSFAPVLVFGFLFGVSMDYEVFILSRVREGYARTRSTRAGIIEGVSHTGRLVTSAAIILFFALASLSTANDITVRQIAAGLAAGVVLDAVVVRMLLLPALVSLFGRANWWMPARAARWLRLASEPRYVVDDAAAAEQALAVTAVGGTNG